MSKASEWASSSYTTTSPRIIVADLGEILVNTEGGLNIGDECSISADEALALAHWILDTFGEPPA